MAGKVYLVGAGPGDLGLITVKGLQCIQTADVIVYDNLINKGLLRYARPDAVRINAGKRSGHHKVTQRKIEQMLIRYAHRNKMVCRLKGGDPFIFGRGGEEVRALSQAGIGFEVIPGITSGLAVPTLAGIPLTMRDKASVVVLVAGSESTTSWHEADKKGKARVDWRRLAKLDGTLVIYMGVTRLGLIARRLLEYGKSSRTPCAIIQDGTLTSQRIIKAPLNLIASRTEQAGIKPPAILVIGEVVNLSPHAKAWHPETLGVRLKPKALQDKRIMVTRPIQGTSLLSERLQDLGTEVIETPTIRIKETIKPVEFRKMTRNLTGYDWLIFTSARSVQFFFKHLFASGRDARSLNNISIAVLGDATAQRLSSYGLKADLIPKQFVTESLLEALKKQKDIRHSRVLIVQAENARPLLSTKLAQWGARVKVLHLYRIEPETAYVSDIREEIKKGVNLVTFTSSLTAKNFFRQLGKNYLRRNRRHIKTGSIGPITTKTLRAYGIKPVLEAKPYNINGLVKAIKRYFA